MYIYLLYALQDRWDLEDTPETEEKVLKIAKERYRGWRSTLSSTYKAYKTDAARLANLPEDLQPEEWEWMIEYFGTDSKFQVISKITLCLLCVKMKLLFCLVIFGFNSCFFSFTMHCCSIESQHRKMNMC